MKLFQSDSCAFLVVCLACWTLPFGASNARDVPQEFEQILPRGSIDAIDDPQFVPAARASIRAEAWVLGVVVDGEAHAYSLNLLNSHEIVNDTIGGTAFAAVW